MKIAVEGCAHGELDNIYSSIEELEEKENIKIDLLICCGDFQSSRNEEDLNCMAVPSKYRNICSFYKYYSGEKFAPVLTIFIGGNHEASNYLQELPYGGWVAKNIYFLGYAGVIDIAGIRIGGLSGIYKSRDFLKGKFEKPPYDENTKRSVYHVRNLEVFRLKQLSNEVDIFLSHDWPTGIYNFGNIKQLLKKKPFFKEEVKSNQLGSKPCEELLNHLQPKYWFAAHLHCKFAALVPHADSLTKFLALDKCLPHRSFLQIVEIPHSENKKIQISYDLEWLTILHLTNHLLNVKNTNTYMPGPGGYERYIFTPSDEEKNLILEKFNNNLKVPENFRPTAPAFQPGSPKNKIIGQPEAKLNPQTLELCEILGIKDPICLISECNGTNITLDSSIFENTTFISDSEGQDSIDESLSNLDSDILVQEAKIKEQQQPEFRAVTPLKLPKPKDKDESINRVPSDSDICSELLISQKKSNYDAEISLKEDQEINASDNFNSIAGNVSLNKHQSFIEDDDENPTYSIATVLETSVKESGQNYTDVRILETNVSPSDDNQLKTSPKITMQDIQIPNDVKPSELNITISNNGETEVKSNTPTPKKFKRRNAGIYTTETQGV